MNKIRQFGTWLLLLFLAVAVGFVIGSGRTRKIERAHQILYWQALGDVHNESLQRGLTNETARSRTITFNREISDSYPDIRMIVFGLEEYLDLTNKSPREILEELRQNLRKLDHEKMK